MVGVTIYGKRDVEETTMSSIITDTLTDICPEVIQIVDPYRDILKRRKNCIVLISKGIKWISKALDHTVMINLGMAVMNRSDYCNDMCIEDDFPNIILTDGIDTAAERNIIEEMTPDLNISAAPVGMKHEHISIPTVPVAGPYTRIPFIKRILALLVIPSLEGWRENAVRS